jgi:hypothetical protein
MLDEHAVVMPPLGHKAGEMVSPPRLTGDSKMKRSELIIGKAYYINTSANWLDKTYCFTESYPQGAEKVSRNKVIIVETQLKTEHQRKYRTREVLIQNHHGDEVWVSLTHIRMEWGRAVKLIVDEYRRAKVRSYDDRGNRYARHLANKKARDVIAPAREKMMQEMRRVSGKYVSEYSDVRDLPLEVMLLIGQALSGIKTELKEVA